MNHRMPPSTVPDTFLILAAEKNGVGMAWGMVSTLLGLMGPTYGQVKVLFQKRELVRQMEIENWQILKVAGVLASSPVLPNRSFEKGT